MSSLLQPLFSGSPILLLPLGALLLFVGVFAAKVWGVMRRRPASFEAHARLPLEPDNHE